MRCYSCRNWEDADAPIPIRMGYCWLGVDKENYDEELIPITKAEDWCEEWESRGLWKAKAKDKVE